jgi:aminoglycoside phosphotransferase (APT) family kinase protein
MREDDTPETRALFARVVQKIDPQGQLIHARKLEGGVSARVTALEFTRGDGKRQKVLVRQHGAIDLAQNPQVATTEFHLLQALRAEGLAVPEPVYLEQSGELFSTPFIVVEYVEGGTEFAPADVPACLAQLAAFLARLHRVDCTRLNLPFLPRQEVLFARRLRDRPARLDESLDEGRVRATLEAAWPLTQHNPTVVLHGDFWPGNVLWRSGALAAVVDWEDAALGDPLADLGNCRLELLWAFGPEAMLDFTRRYLALHPVDLTNLPYWDLCAALRSSCQIENWIPDARAAEHMRTLRRWFVNRAFEVLSA